MWASYKGHEDIVRELLDYGADPNERGQVSVHFTAFLREHMKSLGLILLNLKMNVGNTVNSPLMDTSKRRTPL